MDKEIRQSFLQDDASAGIRSAKRQGVDFKYTLVILVISQKKKEIVTECFSPTLEMQFCRFS